MPYDQDAAIEEVAALIERASGAGSRFRADKVLRSGLPPLISDDSDDSSKSQDWSVVHRATSWAFAYRITEQTHSGRPRIVIEPYFSTGDRQTPPPVNQVPTEILEAWEALTDRVEAPFAVARLNHLLFAARRGNGRDRARAAIGGYLVSANQWKRDSDSIADLSIALRLANAVQQTQLTHQCVQALRSRAEAALSDIASAPGPFLRSIEPLTHESAVLPDVDNLLRQAADLASDPSILSSIYELRLGRTAAPSERRNLQALAIQNWLNAAEDASGLVKSAHLQRALETAKRFNRRDLGERAAAALQGIAKEDLGMVSFSASTAIADEVIEQMLAPVVQRDDWRESLALLASPYLRATGAIEENRQAAAKQAQQFVFQSILRKQLLGGDGLPRFTPENEADKQEMALAEQESFRLQTTAPLIARALNDIASRNGIPAESDLTEFFTANKLITDKLAGALARVLIRYWAGDYEGAAFTAAPRIESLARGLVIALDAGVYQLQRQQRPGQYPGLAALLSILKDRGLEVSWYRMVYTICCNPAGGWNIRNEIVHGFADNIYAPVAAVLIQAILHLTMLAPGEGRTDQQTSEDDPQ